MKRKLYYNPKLDPNRDPVLFGDDTIARGGTLIDADAVEQAPNIISSKADDGFHYPALDIDVPCRYVPSSTPGHGHLFFDETKLNWDQYIKLMQALVEAGIVEEGWFRASMNDEQSCLRTEGYPKFSAGGDTSHNITF